MDDEGSLSVVFETDPHGGKRLHGRHVVFAVGKADNDRSPVRQRTEDDGAVTDALVARHGHAPDERLRHRMNEKACHQRTPGVSMMGELAPAPDPLETPSSDAAWFNNHSIARPSIATTKSVSLPFG